MQNQNYHLAGKQPAYFLHTVIEFLDSLRDLLWATYSDEIIAMLKAESEKNPDSDESDPGFDDEMDFYKFSWILNRTIILNNMK